MSGYPGPSTGPVPYQPAGMPGWDASGLANPAIRAYNNAYNSSPQQGGGSSSLEQLMQKLLASMNAGQYKPPSDQDLSSQAWNTVAGQYDPQIAALQNAEAIARSNAANSKVAIGKIYQGLAGSYKQDLGETKKQFKDAKKGEQANLKQYTDQIKGDYGASMKELADQYKKLGIQAAGGDSTLGALATDQAFNTQQADQTSNIAQQAYGQQQLGDQQYWVQGMGTAQLTGANKQADLASQLQQYLQEQGGQIQSLEGQKQSAYNAALLQLKQQVADQASKQQNDTWSKLLQLGQFQMDVGKYNQSMNTQSSAIGKGLSGATQYIAQATAERGGSPTAYANAIQTLVLKIQPGMTPEQAAQAAASQAQQQGLDPTIMANAMLAYFGRV